MHKKWTRQELILALQLYCKTPFGRIHIRNPEVISLAELIGRSPSAVSWKLANFSRFDPSLKLRDIKGASHGSKADAEIWEEFFTNGEELILEANQILLKIGSSVEKRSNTKLIINEDFQLGVDRASEGFSRIGQTFFRSSVLASYEETCCVTGLNNSLLLNASHISPWSTDKANRVNPCNGLCLNALHDRAFDRGLMTISEDLRVVYSDKLIENADSSVKLLFLSYEGKEIILPNRFRPDPDLLDFHRKTIFVS